MIYSLDHLEKKTLKWKNLHLSLNYLLSVVWYWIHLSIFELPHKAVVGCIRIQMFKALCKW